MPSWTPGSYLLREFPRNVQDFNATDGSEAALAWTKLDKNCWRVEAPSDGSLRVRYRVYANELSVRTSHLDASHGYVNGASVFMYAAGREREPIRLRIDAPPPWRATTALTSAGPETFCATDYAELIDSPIEIGTHELLEWEVEGIPHRYAIWGRGNYDAERIVADTRRIIEAARELWGGLPYDSYTFILHLTSGGYGGLEHRDSTSLLVDRWTFEGKEYEKFLGLVAHEFFHTWNGKRLRPEPLGNPDLMRENYTRGLWVVEGLTTYYTDLLLRRAGLITATRYGERLGEMIGRLQALPGRHVQTLEESSFDTWIKFYRPDAHTPNSQISYYQKGALVGLLLDLRIREATDNRRSLDDVMRRLWTEYGSEDRPFPEGRGKGIEAIAAEISGTDLTDFFDRALRSTEELDYNRYLAVAGLRLGRRDRADDSAEAVDPAKRRPAAPNAAAAGTETPLGMRIKNENGRVVVTHVLAGTPAYEAGVNAGDELLALDGFRVTPGTLPTRLSELEPGNEVRLAVFRRDELLALPVEVRDAIPPPPRMERVEHPTPLQRVVYAGWLGVEVDGVSHTGAEPEVSSHC